MSGIFTDKSKKEPKRSFFYDTAFDFNGNSNVPYSRGNVSFAELFGATGSDLSAMNSVTSYRSNRSDGGVDPAVARMLDESKAYNPLLNHDTGHEFDLRKYSASNLSTPYVDLRGYGEIGRYWAYRGPIGIYSAPRYYSNSLFQKVGGFRFWDTDIPDVPLAKGTQAISACSPSKSSANVAAGLMELKDGFPKMLGKSLKAGKINRPTKAVGDEYLNLMFGWIPTLSDIRSIAVAMVNAPKIINQYQRDSDRIVRRRYYFPKEVTTTSQQEVLSRGYGLPMMFHPVGWTTNVPIGDWGYGGLDTASGDLPITLTEQRTTKTWFSGAFRYHLTTDPSVFGRMDRVSQIAAKWLGARADLNAFWQVMPWSWFIDWFVDFGDIVANANNALLDGQVLQWGYLMQETVVKRTFTTDEPIIYKNGGATYPIGHLSSTFVSQRKQRRRATPFGFGLDPGTFSAQQWAILGALGMTKSPKSLF